MLIGYVRVSTNDQNTALQRNALDSAGCELIFEDKISGRATQRPGLKKLLKTLSEGDAGLAAARVEGRIGGRKPKLTPKLWAQAGRLLTAGKSRREVAIIYDVGISTLYKKFPATKLTE